MEKQDKSVHLFTESGKGLCGNVSGQVTHNPVNVTCTECLVLELAQEETPNTELTESGVELSLLLLIDFVEQQETQLSKMKKTQGVMSMKLGLFYEKSISNCESGIKDVKNVIHVLQSLAKKG